MSLKELLRKKKGVAWNKELMTFSSTSHPAEDGSSHLAGEGASHPNDTSSLPTGDSAMRDVGDATNVPRSTKKNKVALTKAKEAAKESGQRKIHSVSIILSLTQFRKLTISENRS